MKQKKKQKNQAEERRRKEKEKEERTTQVGVCRPERIKKTPSMQYAAARLDIHLLGEKTKGSEKRKNKTWNGQIHAHENYPLLVK
jgi:hypothetical protein